MTKLTVDLSLNTPEQLITLQIISVFPVSGILHIT